MFLRSTTRKKDGKIHRYYSVVENRRLPNGRVFQRPVLYLGEINDLQLAHWQRSIEQMDEQGKQRTKDLFEPADAGWSEASSVQFNLLGMQIERPRQFGALWLAMQLWQQLKLDVFWQMHLPMSRKGTRWDQVLLMLVAYRLIAPGSEWRLYRQWSSEVALEEVLGCDATLSEIHKLYACHDQILAHKQALFSHLKDRWVAMFKVRFDVLLYDLTSTYFESPPPDNEQDKRRFGYSRDKRSDCVQVVIALIVTPEGLPLAYEVMPGNTRDCTTLKGFLQKIKDQYGEAERTWVMDRGIPTEAVLSEMRSSEVPVRYLVGTPRGRLTKLEAALSTKPWQQAREGVEVKCLPKDGETYVLAKSEDRVSKERSMRLLGLRRLIARLKQLQGMTLTSEALLMKLGAAKHQYPAASRVIKIKTQSTTENTTANIANGATFSFALDRKKLRKIRLREGRYLLRTNITETDPSTIWQHYLQLNQVEQAFKTLKHDLSVRPIWHQKPERIEAHIFLSFLAYCLQITLYRQLHVFSPGLTARSALETLATVQMVDVIIPTTDGRKMQLTRHTKPSPPVQLLLAQLNLELPPQPPPKFDHCKMPVVKTFLGAPTKKQ